MRQRALAKQQLGVRQEEVLAKEEERSGPEDEEEGETSDEETDSEEEEAGARLKPVFVRAKDRLTIQVALLLTKTTTVRAVQEREREEARARQAEREAAKLAEERRRSTLRMVEDEVRKTEMALRKAEDDTLGLEDVVTDDENDEVEYEAWKVRELRRLKRDKDEREEFVKELAELERFRNLTEEEKRAELKANPKEITNRAVKGKYKFMQKYYHRSAILLYKYL